MKTFTGGCHCGRVRFEITTDLARVSECNCSICAKKGYLHHMVTADRFRLRSGGDDLAAYQFGTHTARHLFCRHCGVASFYRPRLDPSQYMVNARCLDDVDLSALQIVRFDGRSWEARPDAPYGRDLAQRAPVLSDVLIWRSLAQDPQIRSIHRLPNPYVALQKIG